MVHAYVGNDEIELLEKQHVTSKVWFLDKGYSSMVPNEKIMLEYVDDDINSLKVDHVDLWHMDSCNNIHLVVGTDENYDTIDIYTNDGDNWRIDIEHPGNADNKRKFVNHVLCNWIDGMEVM